MYGLSRYCLALKLVVKRKGAYRLRTEMPEAEIDFGSMGATMESPIRSGFTGLRPKVSCFPVSEAIQLRSAVLPRLTE